jgi:hypothetical protein
MFLRRSTELLILYESSKKTWPSWEIIFSDWMKLMEKKCKLFLIRTNDVDEILYKNSSFNLVAKKKHGHHWHIFFLLIEIF